MVGSRSHIPVQVKESFGCFSPNPRGRKVPTAITSEQPTLEGPLPRLIHLCCQVRHLAPTPQPTLALPDLTSGERFSHLLPWASAASLAPRRALPAGRSQSTVDFGQAGRWPGKGCSGSSLDTALSACLLRPSPTFPGGSRAPGAGHGRSPAGEHPGAAPRAGTGREPLLLRPSHPTGWTGSGIATWPTSPAAPSARDDGHVARMGWESLLSERGVTWRCKPGADRTL